MKLNDLTGKKYGKLIVKERCFKNDKNTWWSCLCDCGNNIDVRSSSLIKGNTKSCGCLRSEIESIKGNRYGKLVAIRYVYTKNRKTYWEFMCDCGKTKIIQRNTVTDGSVKSCGCLFKTRNGKSNSRKYSIWKGIIDRCYNKNNKHYYNYGGRGIKVCDEWKDKTYGFENFLEWIEKDGNYNDILTLDRINNDGDYSPYNCRWATRIDQNNNKRVNRIVEYKGKKYTISNLAREYNMDRRLLDARINHGWSIEDAVDIPKMKPGQKRVARIL